MKDPLNGAGLDGYSRIYIHVDSNGSIKGATALVSGVFRINTVVEPFEASIGYRPMIAICYGPASAENYALPPNNAVSHDNPNPCHHY